MSATSHPLRFARRGYGYGRGLGVAAMVLRAVGILAVGDVAGASVTGPRPHDVATELIMRFGDRPGFGAVTIEGDTVQLRWRGHVPDDVARTIRERAASSHVRIVTATSRYSQEELAVEGTRLVQTFQVGWPHVLGAGPNADSSALRLQLAPGTLAEVGDRSLQSLLGTTYPLAVVEEDAPTAG